MTAALSQITSAPQPPPAAMVTFPQGLPGFPGASAYRLQPLPGSARLMQLSSTAEAGPTFILLQHSAEADYLSAEDLTAAAAEVGLEPAEASVLFVITAARHAQGAQLSINRRAPVLVDLQRGIGFQVVLPRPDYAIRHPLHP